MKSRRIAPFVAILLTAAAFIGLAVGPERINPLLSSLLGLQAPRPSPSIPVPGASETSVRVLDTVSHDAVRAHMDRFTGHGSRIPGYPGHNAAAVYIRQAFERAGLQDVRAEPFDVTAPIDKGGKLTLLRDKTTFPIHAIWPNLVKTSTLPREGFARV